MTTHFADINGTRLAWEETGNGHPVVLVHAGIADRRMWQSQIEPLSQTHRVITFDQRGYGESPMVAGRYSYLNDLIALLDALDLASPILIGCSMGGTTLLDLAVAHPDRVSALVISNSTPRGFELQDTVSPEFEAAFEQAEANEDIDQINELEIQYWIDGVGRASADVDPEVRNLVLAMNLIALRNESIGGEEFTDHPGTIDRLEEIAIPTLVFAGEHDRPRTIAGCRLITDRIPGARHQMIANAAHLPALEQPEIFNQHLRDFLIALSS